MKFVVYLLGIIGAVGSLVFSFSFTYNNAVIFWVCIGLGIGIYYFYQNSKNKHRFMIGTLCASCSLVLFPTTLSCLRYLIAIVIYKYREVSVYNFSFSTEFIYFDDLVACTITFLMIFIPMFLLTIVALERKKYFLGMLALLPGVFIELLFTITPPWFFIASYLLYTLILLIAAMQKGTFLKKPMIIISITAMVITYLAFPIDSYQPSRYSLFENAKTPLATAGNLKEEYDITRQGDRNYRNSLDFTISNEGVNDLSLTNFKIRGIAYSSYDEGKWESINQNEIDWFTANIEMIALVTNATSQKIKINQLSGYSQRNYTPYFMIDSDLTYYGDHYRGENPQSYQMIVPNDDFNAVILERSAAARYQLLEEIALKNGTKGYLQQGLASLEIGRQKFLSVPKETSEVIERFLLQNGVVDNGDIFDYINQCTNALNSNTTYTLTPGHDPKGDMIDYFLNVSKKGYCVHYATTLALMLRNAGYPARFAVGYQVPGNKSENGDLLVRDSNAHAWVEILDDNLGWIPIEATPTGSENPNVPTDTVTPAPLQPQTTPTDPNDPATPQNDDLQTPDKKSEFVIPSQVYYLIGIIILIVMIVIQAKIRRSRMFDGAKNNNERICYYYHYLNKLGINCSDIKDIIDKARFSQYQITDDELMVVKEFYDQNIKVYYRRLNIIKKIYFKYILVRL